MAGKRFPDDDTKQAILDKLEALVDRARDGEIESITMIVETDDAFDMAWTGREDGDHRELCALLDAAIAEDEKLSRVKRATELARAAIYGAEGAGGN